MSTKLKILALYNETNRILYKIIFNDNSTLKNGYSMTSYPKCHLVRTLKLEHNSFCKLMSVLQHSPELIIDWLDYCKSTLNYDSRNFLLKPEDTIFVIVFRIYGQINLPLDYRWYFSVDIFL